MGMDVKALRFAADCWDRKSDMLRAQGKNKEADEAIDMAISLRLEAIRWEDEHRIGIGAFLIRGDE